MSRTPSSRLVFRPVTTDQAGFKLAWPRRSLLDRITLRLRAVPPEVKIAGTLAVGVGLTSVAGQIGLDQQAAAGFYLGAVALLSGRSLPPGDGMPDFMEEMRKPTSPQKLRPASTKLPARTPSVERTRDVLVDNTGKLMATADLPHHLGYPEPDFDLAGYAVKHLGMVHLAGDTLRVNPTTVSSRALEVTGFLLLSRHDGAKVRITAFVDGAWALSIHRSGAEAFDALNTMTSPAPRFSASADNLDVLQGPMHQAFLTWRDSGGEMSDGAIARLRDSGAWDRTVALRTAEGEGTGFAFIHIGKGITAFGESWRERMIGKIDDGRPDPDYAAEVSSLYRHSLVREMPAVNRVWATLRMERRAPVDLRYRQLLLPWAVSSGRKRLAVLTSITERLPLAGQYAAA